MALAGMTASVDIPRSRPAAADKAEPGSKHNRAGLPTPPNSISPSLPSHGFKDHGPPTPPAHTHDGHSDIDLQDAVEHAAAQDQPTRGLALAPGDGRLAALDTAGAITPTLLATHHLPHILLAHGPLAIRHIMGYLTTTVPGFSGIPSAKARRLVVGALEGRGGNTEASGGVGGDVIFEKVGWGRWDARKRGQPSRHRRHGSPTTTRHPDPATGLRSPSPSSGLRIPHRARPGGRRMPSSTSLAHSHQSYDYHHSGHDTDTDKMSLDGSDLDGSGSSVPPEEMFDDDMGEATDEEDWASLGVAALRAGSFPKGSHGAVRIGKKYNYNKMARFDTTFVKRGGGPANSALAKSAPGMNNNVKGTQDNHVDLMEGVNEDEGEAVRALLRLGSV